MLEIFLAEVGEIRPDDIQQLQYHRGDAGKVTGAKLSLERLRDLPGDDPGRESLRIHFHFAGGKDCVNSQGLQEFQVTVQVSRVIGEVLGRVELFGVDENRDHDDIALPFGLADE